MPWTGPRTTWPFNTGRPRFTLMPLPDEARRRRHLYEPDTEAHTGSLARGNVALDCHLEPRRKFRGIRTDDAMRSAVI